MATVDRTKPVRQSELRLSGFFVQHMCEYANADSAGVQRAIDYMQSVYDTGWVATHGSSPSFRQRDAMEVEGSYQWATASNMRGLYDPATGNQAVVPCMARVSKAKRLLVSFGVPKPYSTNPTSGSYDFAPCRTDSYTKLGQFWVRVLQEAKNRGTPFHGVSHRQELKGQPNRSFGAGGGGQSEVDSYNAIRQAVKSWDPTLPMFGPHLALGGTRTISDRQRPLQWAWDRDFLTGWMSRVDGWDGVFLDWASIDMNASGAAEGTGNPDLVATWIANWRQVCSDFFALPGFGAGKPKRLGFIEHYSLEVNLPRWNLYTDAQKAAFQFACLCQLALGGAAEVFDWQPEGSNSGTTFQDYFGLFNKTAIGSASTETGKPNAKGQAVKAFHDLVPPGATIYDVQTGDPRVYGVATDSQTALVNLRSTPYVTDVEGASVTISPYAYVIAPRATNGGSADGTVTIPSADYHVAYSNLETIASGSRTKAGCVALAKEALAHLPAG